MIGVVRRHRYGVLRVMYVVMLVGFAWRYSPGLDWELLWWALHLSTILVVRDILGQLTADQWWQERVRDAAVMTEAYVPSDLALYDWADEYNEDDAA